MKLSKAFIPTLKEVPTDAIIPSHILMLRTGMVRMLSAGIYSFLPLGYTVVKKVVEIIREEMDAIGGQEFHLPALNPKEIWEETNRVEAFGDTMFHIKNRDYVLAPTHEEIMTYHAKGVVKSYKDMPQIWYQIQTKFRNEPRPKSGVIRGRQFLMKDAYSFDTSWENLDKSYAQHDKAYRKIFGRCDLKYFVVGASSGAMGGNRSEEFMVKSEAGEDTVAHCEHCGYAANVEVATSVVDGAPRFTTSFAVEEISTPKVKSIDELCEFLKINETQCAKSRVYIHNDEPVLVLMLGNDEVNETKLGSVLPGTLRPGHPDELKEITGADAGSIGPIGFKGRIIADLRLKDGNNLYSGANKNDYHIGGIDLMRDVPTVEYFDLRTVQAGEVCTRCGEKLDVFKAIELGHIFKLGTRYSEAMGATFLDEQGKVNPIIMGSYGIGVERVIACYIEQHNDEKGIIWDNTLAPYQFHLMGLNMKKQEVIDASNKIYNDLMDMGYDVLFDDRVDAQAGFKFNDADLLGLPVQVIVGDKNLKENKVEVKVRKTGERFTIEIDKLYNKLKELI
ncbi:MAG: proline--tRNA ligase [Ignavibacteria bacterium]|jgi:prolyl-tRNA synthetase|nr:proline--tRNA ligase [Ignavibacteria bacterium]MCU7513584.1 proline--tRNA ligase [Ignavibacteria bacterium]MCU7520980.1 proline--tRNA ligase [Ignavibacteria bacterium]MCU7525071.1 proline--tRNA ligase [Ignavibacteria bacterium]